MIKSFAIYLRDFSFNRLVFVNRIFGRFNNRQKIVVGIVISKKSPNLGSAGAMYDSLVNNPDFDVFLVCNFLDTQKALAAKGYNAHYRRAFSKIRLFLKTDVWLTTHGKFGIPIVGGKKRSYSIELWHGIPFGNVNSTDVARKYNEHDAVLVTSEYLKDFYVNNWRVDADILKITGYPRNDALINNTYLSHNIRKELGLESKKIVLYAPTHEQAGGEKSLFPWNSFQTFKTLIDGLDDDTTLIVRTHPNWKGRIDRETAELFSNSNAIYLPFKKYNNTEKLLSVTDVLITDWSSIYFDFILLNRPTIFLDLPHPFENGLVMGPESRVGYQVSNGVQLKDKVLECLNDSNIYSEKFSKRLAEVISKAHKFTDGQSTERCVNLIKTLVRGSS